MSSSFNKSIAYKTLKEGNRIEVEEKTIPKKRLTPVEYYELYEDDIKKQRKERLKREEKEQQKIEQLAKEERNNDKEDQESTEANQETSGEWRTFTSTFYTADCDGCIGKTTNGTNVRDTIYTPNGHRVIAADPNVLPLNSLVKVKFDDREFVARVADTGGAIKGNKIDVLVETKNEANNKGVQEAKIKIID